MHIYAHMCIYAHIYAYMQHQALDKNANVNTMPGGMRASPKKKEITAINVIAYNNETNENHTSCTPARRYPEGCCAPNTFHDDPCLPKDLETKKNRQD